LRALGRKFSAKALGLDPPPTVIAAFKAIAASWALTRKVLSRSLRLVTAN
jgi:hypothetical protein